MTGKVGKNKFHCSRKPKRVSSRSRLRILPRRLAKTPSWVLGQYAQGLKKVIQEEGYAPPITLGTPRIPIEVKDVSFGKLVIFHANFRRIMGNLPVVSDHDARTNMLEPVIYRKLFDLITSLKGKVDAEISDELIKEGHENTTWFYRPISQIHYVEIGENQNRCHSLTVGVFLSLLPREYEITIAEAKKHLPPFTHGLFPKEAQDQIQRETLAQIAQRVDLDREFGSDMVTEGPYQGYVFMTSIFPTERNQQLNDRDIAEVGFTALNATLDRKCLEFLEYGLPPLRYRNYTTILPAKGIIPKQLMMLYAPPEALDDIARRIFGVS